MDVKPSSPKPEVDASTWKLKLTTSGSELSDDEEHDMLNENLSRGDLKRVKRYVIREAWCKVKCISCYQELKLASRSRMSFSTKPFS